MLDVSLCVLGKDVKFYALFTQKIKVSRGRIVFLYLSVDRSCRLELVCTICFGIVLVLYNYRYY